jgi:hypothetical protein
LQALAGWRLFPDSGSDRPLGVEQRTEPAARQDAEREPLAAGSEAAQIEGGAPAHLAGVVGRDELVALVHLGRPPVAHPLQQAGEAGIYAAVAVQHKAHPVAAGRQLAALASAALGLLDCFAESFRPRRAELDRQNPLHRTDPNQPGLNRRASARACRRRHLVERDSSSPRSGTISRVRQMDGP